MVFLEVFRQEFLIMRLRETLPAPSKLLIFVLLQILPI
jgi:hypothetical protein